MFGKRKPVVSFDPTAEIPVLRMSICTGEKTFCFRNAETGHVTEIACVKTEREYQALLRQYGVKAEDVKREW